MSVKACNLRERYDRGKSSRKRNMQITTETILFITIWSLTGIGLFFGTRVKIRKRRIAKEAALKEKRYEPGTL